MAYSELVTNLEKTRDYIREFYAFGFRTDKEYDIKRVSAYKDEARHIADWTGDCMQFAENAEGKNIFISKDSRRFKHNPFYNAWKAKAVTDTDVTLQFLIFDILHAPEVKLSFATLIEELDRYQESFDNPQPFEETVVRKKLREYTAAGMIQTEKVDRRVIYSRTPGTELSALVDYIDFFSETAPCGVVGSFLEDRLDSHSSAFAFQAHHLMQAMNSGLMVDLFAAMQEGSQITCDYWDRQTGQLTKVQLIPMKIYISAQDGWQYLLAYHEKGKDFYPYRLDCLTGMKLGEPCNNFAALRKRFHQAEAHMWDVCCHDHRKDLEHVMFEIQAAEEESYFVDRLMCEKRCGHVEQVDDTHYRFEADVFDTMEMLPWIRTFTSHLTKISFSNHAAEEQFRETLQCMYQMYDVDASKTDGGDDE